MTTSQVTQLEETLAVSKSEMATGFHADGSPVTVAEKAVLTTTIPLMESLIASAKASETRGQESLSKSKKYGVVLVLLACAVAYFLFV